LKHPRARSGSSSVTPWRQVGTKLEWAAVIILLSITAMNLGIWNALFVFLGTALVLGIVYLLGKYLHDRNYPPET
jgi:hypothetical protein